MSLKTFVTILFTAILFESVTSCKSTSSQANNADLAAAPDTPAFTDFFKRNRFNSTNQARIRSGVAEEIKKKGKSLSLVSKILSETDLKSGLDVMTAERVPLRAESLESWGTDYQEFVIRFSDRTFSRIGLNLEEEDRGEVLE